MTTTVAVLLEGTFATAGGVTYTSDNCVTAIDKLTGTNEAGANAVATVALYSPDGTELESIVKTITPGQTWPFPEVVGHVLASGGKMVISCPTVSAIKCRSSGRKFT